MTIVLETKDLLTCAIVVHLPLGTRRLRRPMKRPIPTVEELENPREYEPIQTREYEKTFRRDRDGREIWEEI